jgi:hypothetical protein
MRMQKRTDSIGSSWVIEFQDPDDLMPPQADSQQKEIQSKIQKGIRRQIEANGRHETSVFSLLKTEVSTQIYHLGIGCD